MMNLTQIVLDHPQLSRADIAVLIAIEELGPDAYRSDLAEMASISKKRVTECRRRLEEAGLL